MSEEPAGTVVFLLLYNEGQAVLNDKHVFVGDLLGFLFVVVIVLPTS